MGGKGDIDGKGNVGGTEVASIARPQGPRWTASVLVLQWRLWSETLRGS